MITEEEIEKELAAIDSFIPLQGKSYTTLTDARIIAKEVIDQIKGKSLKIAIVGSIWREHPTVGDVDLVVVPLGTLPLIKQHRGVQINIFESTLDSWGASLIH